MKPKKINNNSYSPQFIARICAASLGTGSWFLATLFLYLFTNKFYAVELFLPCLLVSIAGYFLVIWLIEKFIHQKIKIIYKTIHNLRRQAGKGIQFNLSEDILKQVNRDVITWADVQKKEIKKLQDRESFRRDFIGNLAHELKTPIFSIQNYILTLLEGGLEDERVNRKFLEKASKGVDRMVALTNDLDSIAKLEAGRLEITPTVFSVIDLASEILESLENKAHKRNVTLTINTRKFKSTNVKADKNKIGQVFTNLLANSINYSKEEGGLVEINFYDIDERILVEIKDNGMGIPEDKLPRIFERFYRVDNHRARDVGGSGLGLAICKHIITVAHKERIDVQSKFGVGSTFSFTLKKDKS